MLAATVLVAAILASDPPPPRPAPQLGALLEKLSSEETATVEEAAEALSRLGEKGLPTLWEGLASLYADEEVSRAKRPRRNRTDAERAILRAFDAVLLELTPREIQSFVARTALAAGAAERIGPRLAWARLLPRIDAPEARYHLERFLVLEKDFRVRAAAVEAMAEAAPAAPPDPLVRAVGDTAWPVRRLALAAIARAKSREALPRLLELIEQGDGPGIEDAYDALRALSGQKLGDRRELWLRWWKGERSRIEGFVGAPSSDDDGVVTASPAVAFFGLPIRSRQAFFVIDASASMADPPARATRTQDSTRASSKWAIMRAELGRALRSLPSGGRFGVAVYSDQVRFWRPRMERADERHVADALAFVDRYPPSGGTNLAAALDETFDLATETSDPREGPAIDTIYLLSDGLPTSGRLVEPEDLLEETARRNRLLRLRLHTVAAGRQDREFLERLASGNEGLAVDLHTENR